MKTQMRLIDADKLEKLVVKHSAAYSHKDDILAAIAAQPTVDAVEVVRCKDCKYRKRPLFAGNGIYCVENRRHFELDDFCSYGERRTDNEKS